MFKFLKRDKKKGMETAGNGNWRPLVIGDIFTGGWQEGKELKKETLLTHYAVFSCLSLISQDIAKLPFVFVRKNTHGVLRRIDSDKLKSLRKPNYYQNHIQFKEAWMLSKLMYGNTYVLQLRDMRGMTIGHHILDPKSVTPLVSDSGSVYYKLAKDKLAGCNEVIVPASEIIHDRFNCLFHPLVGISPLYAASASVKQGLKIQENSLTFFSNKAVPSGLLTAPGTINDDTAKRMKEHWERNYSGNGAGKVAVLGDGLKFEPMSMTALDSQLIEQLKLTAEVVCALFKVNPYLAGISDKRPQETVEAIYLEYLQKTLQFHIESMEAVLDDSQDLDGINESIDLDTANILRMDTLNRYKSHSEGLKAAFKTINEVRAEEGLDPVKGGDTPYLQQQNYSLEALTKRDAREDPFAKSGNEPSKSESEAIEEEILKGLIEGFKQNG